MSDKKAGDSTGAQAGRKKSGGKGHAGTKRGGGRSEIGRALRSVYDQTLREDVPNDFRDLLGKLT